MNTPKKLILVGGGVAGHSLLLSLAHHPDKFESIVCYDAPDFFPSCSLNSTAIVAPRGVSTGHSELGDLLMAGFKTFSTHVSKDSPAGVQKISQYTGTRTKKDQFKLRYPSAQLTSSAGGIRLKEEFLLAHEEAFQITPTLYLPWIRDFVTKKLPVTFKQELFSDDGTNALVLKCGGMANSFWDQKLKVKPAQGSYFEFADVSIHDSSFSLTLDGHNLIYHHGHKTLLIGSSTDEVGHYLPPEKVLRKIYQQLSESVDLKLPNLSHAVIKTGLREKAPKRMPYATSTMIGGLYKNGFSLGLEMANRWCKEFL